MRKFYHFSDGDKLFAQKYLREKRSDPIVYLSGRRNGPPDAKKEMTMIAVRLADGTVKHLDGSLASFNVSDAVAEGKRQLGPCERVPGIAHPLDHTAKFAKHAAVAVGATTWDPWEIVELVTPGKPLTPVADDRLSYADFTALRHGE